MTTHGRQAAPTLERQPRAETAGCLERPLLACGVVGPLLFVVAFLLEGATRPDYSAFQHPVSSLEIGELGWMQRANFVVTGLLVLAFAFGLRPAIRRYRGGIWASLLIGLVGIGLVGAGAFEPDPLSGYPPGAPMVLPKPTATGGLHYLFSTPVFTALPAAACVVGYRFATSGRRLWAVYSVATAVAFLTAFALTSVAFGQDPTLMPIGGLLQRLTLVIGLAWLAALAAHLLRRVPAGSESTGRA